MEKQEDNTRGPVIHLATIAADYIEENKAMREAMAHSRATLETLAGHFDATRKIILSGCEGNVTDLGDEEKDEFAEAVQYCQHAKAAIARIDITLNADGQSHGRGGSYEIGSGGEVPRDNS